MRAIDFGACGAVAGEEGFEPSNAGIKIGETGKTSVIQNRRQ
jgi:hypothetical protein